MYLFFDTETTGLPKRWNAPVNEVANWPRLVQFAFLRYDLDGNKVSEGNYVIYPEGYSIPVSASRIHRITTERAMKEGVPLITVLEEFDYQIEKASCLVAHNMSFDEKIMGAEFIRSGLKNRITEKKRICTMQMSTNFCALKGPYGYRWPRLSDLYYKLFNSPLIEAHNASVDIRATAQCFWEMKSRGILRHQEL